MIARGRRAILVSEVLSHQMQISLTDPLGYKIRGAWLHGAALPVADRQGAAFPDMRDELRSLPGIGRYSAGAVMSFALLRDAPVLDTNVARLLRRHFGVAVAPRARTEEL